MDGRWGEGGDLGGLDGRFDDRVVRVGGWGSP